MVVGNLIAQSAFTQNPDLLSMGAEARDGMTGSLVLENNVFINTASPNARFVHVWTDRWVGEVPVRMVNNQFVGPGNCIFRQHGMAGATGGWSQTCC